MGRKKGKKQQRQNQMMASPSSAAPAFEDLGSPSLVEVVKNSNFGDEVVIPPNDDNSFNQNIYKTAFLSGDNVNLERKNSSKGSNASSYHDLIDGGAYDRFRYGAGDRVIAGSRSISHRSLFNDDRSLNRSLNPSKTSLAGSKVSLEWEDMGNERSSSRGGRTSIVIGSSDEARKPFVRSRTVSSGGSVRNSQSTNNNNNNNLLPPLSGTLSHRDISSADVRTFHADSDYLQNHLSKLSIHSNNDEFVLVGGHPPPIDSTNSTASLNQEVPVPRTRSRLSSYSEEQDLGRSVSQQSLTRASSRFSVGTNGTNSNTDDRLILAERYSRSPEAEGLLFQQNGISSRPSSRLSTNSSDRGVGFVEIPTLYSHPDERFDDGEDEEPGEPFRPTSEHSSTPIGAPRARKTLLRNADIEDIPDGRNRRFSSSSSSVSRHATPSTPLLVTSALTPVIPKRHPQMSMSASHSEESLVMKTPQTVQRGNSEQKSLRSNLETIKKTVEIAVQTGNSIRLRQNQHFGDVLSECAYLPDPRGFGMTPTITTSFVPQDEEVFAPKNVPEVKNSSQNSIRARLRHISDIYSAEDSKDSREKETPILTQNYVQIPKNSSQPAARKATQEIVVPISKAPSKPDASSGRVVEIPKTQELNGDTIRKHIPRGRIRDLASAFDKMNDGPVRPLEFKSQVHIPTAIPTAIIPTAREETLWNSRKPSGASRESDVNRADSRMSGPLSGLLNRSSSSAFRSSTQTIRSQEDRRRSTSSSLHHQPHVFTRNTFLTSSVAKPVPLPINVPMSTTYSRENVAGGFVSAFDKASSIEIDRESPLQKTLSNKNLAKSPTKDSTFSEYSRKVDVPVRLEVPINKSRRQLLSNNPRAKTQEIPTFEFESRYESRAVSGDLNNENPSVFGIQKPLFAASREAFGRDTAEDLRGKQDNWPLRPQQHQWTSEFHMNETRNTNSVSSPMYHHTNDHITQSHQQPTTTITEFRINHKQQQPEMLRSVQKPSAHHRPSISSSRHPYSPPATEDAGSRITHHTSQTLQSEDLFATEDSSIRGKIDRMFDFVESDDSRKTLRGATHDLTDTIGTNTNKFHRTESRLLSKEIPEALKASPPKMKSPERRNTVTVPEHFDTDLEYSLSQYREMQREQLRRRLPSADEPQFFRSPTLSAPHAGQSMHAYRSKDIMGTPTAGEKFRFPSSSNRTPLATSTPVESPSGRSYSKSYLEMNNNNTTVPPNETFVSSISGVSAVDKHVDVMRKINRLSYMIENTQKQMSMNEAALMDAVKKGRRSQEIAAHRSILISRETLRLQRNELRRLHAFSAVRRPPPPVAKELRGSVIFKNLIVHLNKLFVSRLTTKDDNSYSFVGLFKFGHQIEATELVPLRVYQGEETDDKLFFVKQIQFSDVPVDFMVTIEIYAMKLQRVPSAKPVELSIGSSLANKCKSLMGPPQKKNPIALETAFKFRGRLVLDRDAAGERCLYLDDVTYPLEGTVMITTQCSRLPESFEIDFRGFLTMFHTISNMASWERYWAVLRRGVVLFWKYPDDEQNGREPKMQIDLTKCTNNSIEKCSADLCPRPESFVIEILVDAEDGTIGSVVEKKRVLLSADTSEMLSQWLFTLNQTLDVIRGPI